MTTTTKVTHPNMTCFRFDKTFVAASKLVILYARMRRMTKRRKSKVKGILRGASKMIL